jgi:hypothetical protein
MDLIAAFPEWLVWAAAGVVGAIALATVARVLLACMDLDGN